VDNYSRGNEFPTIKFFEQKNCWSKYLLNNYSRGNNFARIKKISKKISGQNF
jgi:hypothetical protein